MTAVRMPELLERAGFRLRGRNRADCIHCSGRARLTVSFTDEVAYCHRCAWKANTVTLAKELGISGNGHQKLSADEQLERARELARARVIEKFEEWREDRWQFWRRRLHQHYQVIIVAREILKTLHHDEPSLEVWPTITTTALNWKRRWIYSTYNHTQPGWNLTQPLRSFSICGG